MTTFPANFLACLAFTCGPSIEGGYVNNPKDPGGETNHGLADMADGKRDGKYFGLSIKDLTDEQVEQQYFQRYWIPAGCAGLPSPIDLLVFDMAVNSGPQTSAKVLQGVLGVTTDGSIGPRTLAAVSTWNTLKLVDALLTARLSYMQGCKAWDTFKNGWQNRLKALRVEAVKRIT